MPEYRCYLMNVGHIITVKEIKADNDIQAIGLGKIAFELQRAHSTGFEVWERDRIVHRFIDQV